MDGTHLCHPEGFPDLGLVPFARLDDQTPEYVPADAVHADVLTAELNSIRGTKT